METRLVRVVELEFLRVLPGFAYFVVKSSCSRGNSKDFNREVREGIRGVREEIQIQARST